MNVKKIQNQSNSHQRKKKTKLYVLRIQISMPKVGNWNLSALGNQFSTPKVGDLEPSAFGSQLLVLKVDS
jgi:hypothetical protein